MKKFSESQRPNINEILDQQKREIETGKKIEGLILLGGYIFLVLLIVALAIVERNKAIEDGNRVEIWLLNSYWEKEID